MHPLLIIIVVAVIVAGVAKVVSVIAKSWKESELKYQKDKEKKLKWLRSLENEESIVEKVFIDPEGQRARPSTFAVSDFLYYHVITQDGVKTGTSIISNGAIMKYDIEKGEQAYAIKKWYIDDNKPVCNWEIHL